MVKQVVGLQILGPMIAEILTIAGSIVGSGTISVAVSAIVYRKQNRKMKDDEVQKAQADTDKQQIDLGDMFLEKTIKWGEMIEQNTEKMVNRMMEKLDENDAKRDEDWKGLKQDMEYVKSEIGSMSEYLNGDYQKFKKNKDVRKIIAKKRQ